MNFEFLLSVKHGEKSAMVWSQARHGHHSRNYANYNFDTFSQRQARRIKTLRYDGKFAMTSTRLNLQKWMLTSFLRVNQNEKSAVVWRQIRNGPFRKILQWLRQVRPNKRDCVMARSRWPPFDAFWAPGNVCSSVIGRPDSFRRCVFPPSAGGAFYLIFAKKTTERKGMTTILL